MNPAARLLVNYDGLTGIFNDQPMTNVWAQLFGLDPNNSDLEDNVIACVVALRQQIDFVKARLIELGVPVELTSPGFDRLKHVASPGQINSSWAGHRGNIQAPECRQVFAWASWVLRDEDENDMPSEKLQALHDEIGELEESLQSTEMSSFLRGFIQRQIDTIRSALRVHGIKGGQPLKEALHSIAGAFTVEQNRIQSEHAAAPDQAKSVFGRAASMVKKAAEVADQLGKIRKFGEETVSLAVTVSPFLMEYLKQG